MKPQPTDATYTPWKKTFVIFPKTTLSGERVWLQSAYKRKRTVQWTPPQFPPDAFNRWEYETEEQVIIRKLTDAD